MFVRLNNVVICILNSNTCLLAFRHKSLLTEAPPFLYFQPHTCFSILTVLTAEEILCFTVVGIISVYTGACAVKTFHGGEIKWRNEELMNTAPQSFKSITEFRISTLCCLFIYQNSNIFSSFGVLGSGSERSQRSFNQNFMDENTE